MSGPTKLISGGRGRPPIPVTSLCPDPNCPFNMPTLHAELRTRVDAIEARMWGLLTIGITTLVAVIVQLAVILGRR